MVTHDSKSDLPLSSAKKNLLQKESQSKNESNMDPPKCAKKDDMLLCCSGLKTQLDHSAYDKFVAKFGLQKSKIVDKNITHLVVDVNSNNCADRTLKFLQVRSDPI